MDLHTFSVVARSASGLVAGTASGGYGVAVSTARPNVGSLVPFVSLKGAIATQARVNTDLGRKGLALLEADVRIDLALRMLLNGDADRHIRQVHGLDSSQAFAFTGEGCVEWAGHHVGEDYTVAGNMLVGSHVIEAMAAVMEEAANSELELSARLMLALEAGQAAGGDKRGRQSAALLVASPDPRYYHNLRVDDHVDPVAELRRIYDLVVEHSNQIEREYGPEGLRLFSRIKY